MKRFLFLLLVISGSLAGAVQETNHVTAASTAPKEPVTMDDAVFFIRTESGVGVAFLLEDQDGVWMISNISALEGAKTYKFFNANDVYISFPDQVEVAKTRDLIRFRTDRPAGLRRATSCGFEEELFAFSQCVDNVEDRAIRRLEKDISALQERKNDEEDDEDVDTRIDEIKKRIAAHKENKLKRQEAKENAAQLKKGYLLGGQAVALGPDRIEMSALITWHDSGGPVINKKNEVVGISSHLIENSGLPNWVTEGTRFEDTRRFALKQDGTQWVPMTRKDFQKETGYLQASFDALIVFAEIAEALQEDYFQKIVIPTENRAVLKWIETHNELSRTYFKATNKRYRDQKAVDRAVKKLVEKAEKDSIELIKLVKRLGRDAGRMYRVSIPSYQQQLIDLEELYINISEHMEQTMEDM